MQKEGAMGDCSLERSWVSPRSLWKHSNPFSFVGHWGACRCSAFHTEGSDMWWSWSLWLLPQKPHSLVKSHLPHFLLWRLAAKWHVAPRLSKQVSCMQELLTLPAVSQAPITPSHTRDSRQGVSVARTRNGNIPACSLAGGEQLCVFLLSFPACPERSGRRRREANEDVSVMWPDKTMLTGMAPACTHKTGKRNVARWTIRSICFETPYLQVYTTSLCPEAKISWKQLHLPTPLHLPWEGTIATVPKGHQVSFSSCTQLTCP